MPSSNRNYLKDSEREILKNHLSLWVEKQDKKARDAYVSAEVLPEIQALDPDQFGPQMLSTDKQAKELWERKVKVNKIKYSKPMGSFPDCIFIFLWPDYQDLV